MDKIKEAFLRVREDINNLYKNIDSLKNELKETRNEMIKICDILKHLNENIKKEPKKYTPTNQQIKQTHQHNIPAHNRVIQHINKGNKSFSTGNEGVPADRQTDQQTDTSSKEEVKTTENSNNINPNSIEKAAQIIDSFDDIKKELGSTFKKLTDQEMLVFSAIYQLDEEKGYTDYKTLAEKLHLTESSIRDYIGRLLKKGIPLEKKKINNKMIQLSISKNLKKIASLATIIQLREV